MENRSIIVDVPDARPFADGTVSVTARIVACGKERIVHYRASADVLRDRADFLLPIVMHPAMALGADIRFRAPLPAPLISAIPSIQDVYRKIDPRLKAVAVDAGTSADGDAPHPADVGCFFSGGVDSYYTLLKHEREITKIIFVHGFDIPLSDMSSRNEILGMVRQVARRLGKGLVEVETDVRKQFTNRHMAIADTISPFFASVALLLSARFAKIYLPSCYHRPLSTGPVGHYRAVLDPLWSNGLVRIVHDGDEATRVEKVAFISENDVVRETLHVCWMNNAGADNCGRCGKCLRTMASLRAVGRLSDMKTFRTPLSLRALSRLVLSGTERIFTEDTLRFARGRNSDPELVAALSRALENSYSFSPRMWLVLMLESLRQNPCWTRLYNMVPDRIADYLRKKIYAVLLW